MTTRTLSVALSKILDANETNQQSMCHMHLVRVPACFIITIKHEALPKLPYVPVQH